MMVGLDATVRSKRSEIADWENLRLVALKIY
jgi:hypothetical protein